ncbi:MAG: uroporphyrinogen-III synthase [Magnetococcus sp. DMHC-1]|nr:uroporphyrinogen-III synthase [Magnetococcales bacterium]
MTPLDLTGQTILITRPQPEAAHTARLVEAAGGVPLLAPALVMGPPRDPAPLLAAMTQLASFTGVIVTSAHGAQALLDVLPADGPRPPLHAVGPKTAAVLQRSGYPATMPAQPGDAALLAQTILARYGPGGRFLFLRAETGREALVQILEQAGCTVTLVAAYRADPLAQVPEPVLTALQHGAIHAIPFFSGRSAESFIDALPSPALPWLKQTLIAALSPVTATALRQRNIPVHLVAEQPTAEAILAAIARHLKVRSLGRNH